MVDRICTSFVLRCTKKEGLVLKHMYGKLIKLRRIPRTKMILEFLETPASEYMSIQVKRLCMKNMAQYHDKGITASTVSKTNNMKMVRARRRLKDQFPLLTTICFKRVLFLGFRQYIKDQLKITLAHPRDTSQDIENKPKKSLQLVLIGSPEQIDRIKEGFARLALTSARGKTDFILKALRAEIKECKNKR